MSSTDADSDMSIDETLAWCHEVVTDVSRTFAITINLLDDPMATDICIGYLLCRIPDTIEDAGHIPPEVQAELLAQYEQAVDSEDDADIEAFQTNARQWIPDDIPQDDVADWDVVRHTARVFDAYREQPEAVRGAMAPHVAELVSGMQKFVRRHADAGGLRIQTKDELSEYCYYVAGTVGHMITDLACLPDRISVETEQTLHDRAGGFGRLLQLTNISKDVYDDYERENNVYLPVEWLRAEGVSPDTITNPTNQSAVSNVIERVSDWSESHLPPARKYLEGMPTERGNTLVAWAIPYLLAVGTLREVQQRTDEIAEGDRVTIPRAEVQHVLAMQSDITADALEEITQTVAAGNLVEQS